MEAMLAVLVRWDVDSELNRTAYVYETGQTFTGSVVELLSAVNEALSELCVVRFGEKKAQDMKGAERRFFTQSFQGELSPLADGFLSIPTESRMKTALRNGYKPSAWRDGVQNGDLIVSSRGNLPSWIKALNLEGDK